MVPVALPGRSQGRTLRAVRAAGLVLLAATLLVLAVPLGPRAPKALPALVHGRAAMHRSAEGPLRAGAARVQIALPSRTPVAGYPGRARDDGSGAPLFARALVLEAAGERQILATLDALLIPGELEEAVLRKAALPPTTCLLLAATHTHSGVGGTWHSVLAEWGGNGPYDERVAEAVRAAVAEAIGTATARLEPAQLVWRQTAWPSGPAQVRSGGALDSALTSLRISSATGATIAFVVDYAMHATMEPRRAHRLSADWPGALSARLEAGTVSGVALVIQGASGNATWSRSAGTPDAVARRIETVARELVRSAPPAAVARLSCETALVSLPPAQAGRGVPLLLRRGASNLLALFAEPWAVRTTLAIGGLHLVGVPGEPVGAIAVALRQLAPNVAVVGLADGYVGYVEEPQGTGEAARTYHGPGLAEALGLWPSAPP